MAENPSTSVNHEEIAHLAYQFWQKDGCPHGRDQHYWLEAELHLKATKHLHVEEIAAQPKAKKSAGKPRAKGAKGTQPGA
jgi:hypothetical protein